MAGEGVPQVEVESRFKAFVSYSHADKAAAQKLHRQLEAYRLPKHLRGVPRRIAGETGAGDGRIGAIFRDREDLPAAEDLSDSVKTALSASEALVVLCSPDAQKSPWVTREIKLFREIHPDRPVLAAILRGEPNDAFPEPLKQGREPLAADLRKEGDGPRLGFLKVVAGIAGVPLDALINRDAQRRIKRVTAITVAAVAAMIVMALMTTFALQARNEAQAARADAEGLIEFMLTDLRSELKGVGRLDIMTDVNQRAMTYYEDQFDLSDLSEGRLSRRAQILHALGEDDVTRNELVRALTKFTEAHRVTAAALTRAPDSPETVFSHAQSEYWVGWVYEQRRDYRTAQLYYIAYDRLAQKLVELEGRTVRGLAELAYAQNNLGIVKLRGDLSTLEAEKHFTLAFSYFSEAYEIQDDRSELLLEMANTKAWKADSFFKRSLWSRSLENREQEQKHLNQYLSIDPVSKDAAYRMLINLQAIEIIRSKQSGGEYDLSRVDRVFRELDKLTVFDPTNSVWAQAKSRMKRDFRQLDE